MRLLEIKITLLDTHPPVWRELLVSQEIPLGKLHQVIQAAMGWKDSHLHRFSAGSNRYSDPRFELEDGSTDEGKVLVGDLFEKIGDRLSYEYDFGDNWQHLVRCEGSIESDVQTQYAVCTGGARACPPEDCGGPSGYESLLHILRSPNHPEHAAIRERVGRRFNPENFNVNQTNDSLSRLFRRKR